MTTEEIEKEAKSIYNPRDCKDCLHYRTCYYLEGSYLMPTQYCTCTQGYDIETCNHKGCFSYIKNPSKQYDQDKKLNIITMLNKLCENLNDTRLDIQYVLEEILNSNKQK